MNPIDPNLVRLGVFRGVNLKALVGRLWRLEAMRVDRGCSAPSVRWRAYSRRSSSWGTAWGHATSGTRHITMRLGTLDSNTIEAAAETLLHELVHCACPSKESHGELFCRRLIACAREAFGLQLDTAALLSVPLGTHRVRAYAIDAAIVEAMKAANVGARLLSEVPHSAPPPPTDDERQARQAASRAALSARKEVNARAMLAAWEKRAASVARTASKWRAKVRYYDRKQEAAKKSTGA